MRFLFNLLKWLIGLPVEFGKTQKPERPADPLDQPLFWLTDDDEITVRQAHEGFNIMGSTGSGKTSGSGQTIAKSMLRTGWGGLVLCVKNDECDLWKHYAAETSREKDLLIFKVGGDLRFNFLDYEANHTGSMGAGLTMNLVQLFDTVSEVARREEGKTNADFWSRTVKELITNSITLLKFANKKVSVPNILEVIVSAPKSLENLYSEEFCATSFCYQCITKAERKNEKRIRAEQKKSKGKKSKKRRSEDYHQMMTYFQLKYCTLAEKTRGIIDISFSSMAQAFVREPFGDLFCTSTNFTPDQAYLEGKIIIVDIPIHEYRELGQMSAILIKYLFQRCCERRDVKKYPRSVFIWGDEYQMLYNSNDQKFATTARSLRVSNVCLTQNLSNYLAGLGGENKKSEVMSFVGNLNTSIFHAQSEERTQQFSSDLIGRLPTPKVSMNIGKGDPSFGLSEALEHQVFPVQFSQQKKGGPQNDFEVEAYVFQAGRTFSNNKNHIKVTFKQNI